MAKIHHDQCPICATKELRPYLKCRDFSVTQEAFELYQCASCHFVLTQNAPDEAHIAKYYDSPDYISHSDTKKGLVNRLYHMGRSWMLSRKLRQIRPYIGAHGVLDVGCGTGYFLNYVRDKGHAVAGVEVDEAARRFANDRFELSVQAPEALFSTWADRRFDVITLWHVLEHLHRLDAFMAQFKRLLTAQGRLIIAVPNRAAWEARHFTTHWAGYDVPRHLWHFRPTDIERLAEKHGMEVVRHRHMPLDPFYNALLSARYRRSPAPLLFGAFVGFIAFVNGLIRPRQASSITYELRVRESNTGV